MFEQLREWEKYGEGYARGYIEGYVIGYAQGRLKARCSTFSRLLDMGITIEEAAKLTGLEVPPQAYRTIAATNYI